MKTKTKIRAGEWIVLGPRRSAITDDIGDA